VDAPAALDEGASSSPRDTDTFATARAALEQALRVADAALALLRAELRLARSSAFVLIWLGFALVFLGVGAWLATSAAIAAGIYQLTGNIFYGIGSVALANLLGVFAVLWAMRGCWRELGLPHTRRMLGQIGRSSDEAV
jgi:hypothetical protein